MMDGWAGFGACDAPGVPEPTPLERMTAERDAALAEVQRLREAVKDAADAVAALRGAMVPLSEGRIGWVDPEVRSGMRRLLHDTAAVGRAARALVSPP